MLSLKPYDRSRLRDYSSLFSRQEVSRWFKSDWTNLHAKINRYDRDSLASTTSYLSYLKNIYGILEEHYPNEYVYKNEFIGKKLLDETRSGNSVLFNEFRLGKAVADLVIFNGISKAFEVKTLMDGEARLNHQLGHYCRLFNEVWLIVPQQKLEIYLRQEEKAGVIAYDEATGAFSVEKTAPEHGEIDVNILMEVLHTNEYVSIVEHYYQERPAFNDFNKFKICKELITHIPSIDLNKLFIAAMKRRKINNAFSKRERQFNQLFLSMNYSVSEQRQLLSNLRTTIC